MKSSYIHTLLTLVLYVVSSTILLAQDTGLFEYPEPQAIRLTERQEEVRINAEAREYAVRTILVRINQVQQLKERSSIKLNLPNGKTINAQKGSLNIRNEGQFTWTAAHRDPGTSTHFVITEKGISGWIRSPEYYYMLEPLGDGLHILIDTDPTNFPGERAPLKSDDDNNVEKSSRQKNKASMMSDPQIDILVVYTSAAANQSTDIEAVITGAEDISNLSFGNSIVPASVNVVHTAQVSYTESGDIFNDLCRLTGSSSFTPSGCSLVSNLSAMDNIHSLRNQYRADLVVLLVNSGGAGIGWVHSNVNYAFTVVRWDLAVGNYTFAHEIGHNIGTHHDRPVAEIILTSPMVMVTAILRQIGLP